MKAGQHHEYETLRREPNLELIQHLTCEMISGTVVSCEMGFPVLGGLGSFGMIQNLKALMK